MLVNVGVHRGLFSENFFAKDPAGAKQCHAIITDLLLRHGKVVFDSRTSKNDFTEVIKSQPVLPYWENILNRSTVTEEISGKNVPWWKIMSTDDLASRSDDLAVLLVELDVAQQIFSMKDALSREYHGVCVARCDISGNPEPIENFVRLGNYRYEHQELNQNTVRRDYLEPFLEESSRTVIMDKFVGGKLNHNNLRWFWQLLKSRRSDHGQRDLEIITMIPKDYPCKNNNLNEQLRKSQEALTGRCLGNGSNLASITIHWLDKSEWSSEGKHDRHIRFDDRVIEISSGYEVLFAPRRTDAHFTYWVNGAQHSAYSKITSEEKRASKAALHSYHAVSKNGKIEGEITYAKPTRKANTA